MRLSARQGFTLIELCVVMIIVGLMVTMFLAFFRQYTVNKRQDELIRTTNSVTSALAYYIQDHGELDPSDPNYAPYNAVTPGIDRTFDAARFPCPASPTLKPSDPGFGVEQRNVNTGSCLPANGVTSVNTPDGVVFYGSIPVVTLGISSKHMLDEYGRRFTYAVSERVSNSAPTAESRGGALGGGNTPSGSITIDILDGAGTVTETRSGVAFVIVAHGKNGIGAYDVNGNEVESCAAAGTRDAQNCTRSGRFVDSDLYRSDANNAHDYDDTIIFSLRGIADKRDFWGFGSDTQNIVNLNPGRVGIGTPAPNEMLEVNGNIMARTFLHASDMRLKENVKDFDAGALDKIMAMRTVSFDMIGQEEGGRKFGFIAQELQEIYPDLVHTNDAGYLSVDYVGVTIPVIKALQESNHRKDNEIDELKKQLKDLSERLNAVESHLIKDSVAGAE